MLGKNSNSSVIMFTSFLPAAGKTFSIMNVAAGMALKGSKVILVDLDLRKATLSDSLNVSHSGVAAYLNGKIDDYRSCVDEIAPNLSILPIGTLPPNPTELLLTDRFNELIESLKGEYDYIFLDCPPIDLVADASIITEKADMTVFVVRSGKIGKEALPSIEELYASGKYNHMAMMLNSVELKHKKYGYGKSGYGYGYGYGYGN
jgi:capsular exopolysaccharide synthesis family protein